MDPRLRARRVEVLRLRGRRRLRVLVTTVVLIAVLVSTWWVVEGSPLFDVDAVVVNGAMQTPVSDIIEAANIQKGQPLVKVDVSSARESIAGLPWVADVRSDRSLGGEVSFTITEREAVAAILGTHGWLVLDSGGRVLDETDVSPPGLAVLGASKRSAEPGEWVDSELAPLLEVATHLPAGLAPKIASIETGRAGVELELVSGGRVLVGNTDELDAKFLSTLTMLVRLELGCLDWIDVRAPAVPVLTRLDDCS